MHSIPNTPFVPSTSYLQGLDSTLGLFEKPKRERMCIVLLKIAIGAVLMVMTSAIHAGGMMMALYLIEKQGRIKKLHRLPALKQVTR